MSSVRELGRCRRRSHAATTTAGTSANNQKTWAATPEEPPLPPPPAAAPPATVTACGSGCGSGMDGADERLFVRCTCVDVRLVTLACTYADDTDETLPAETTTTDSAATVDVTRTCRRAR